MAPGAPSRKPFTLASIVVALRPQVIVELGVWRGGSAIPMAIALRHIGAGQLVAVDAWSAEYSASGQEGEHQEWWGKTVGTEGHEEAFRAFMARLEEHRITSEPRSVMRKSTTKLMFHQRSTSWIMTRTTGRRP